MDKTYRYERAIPVIGRYDVVVCGGGPAGIGAAVAAAENGAKTLLVERFGFLGGMATAGYVDPMSEFAYNGSRIGQGKENARKYLESEPALMEEIAEKIRAAAKDADIVEQFELEEEDDELDIRDFDEEEI